jgi:hypothetical protein
VAFKNYPSRNIRCKNKSSKKRLLRAELLEPRALLSATTSLQGMLASTAVNVSSPVSYTLVGTTILHAPTVFKAAASAANPVTGKSVQLSVLGADDNGESLLKYTWTTTSMPTGTTAPTFSSNGVNVSKNTTVTFNKFGTYSFKVTITDSNNLSVTSSVTVNVNQSLTSIKVTPLTASLYSGMKQQFRAACNDQFGNAMSIPSAVYTWNASAGSITTDGMFTTPTTGGPITITANYSGLQGSATVSIIGAPTVAKAATAVASTVTGSTTQLSVLGSSIRGESNLKYSWAATTLPAGATAPTFSKNGTNAAKNVTVTFKHAGTYVLTATITDVGSYSVTNSVTVIVAQTITSLRIFPTSATIAMNAKQQFTASGYDQFGDILTNQPQFNWTASRGSIDINGLYTAPTTSGDAKVTASKGTLKYTANLTIKNTVPTVALAALATASPVTGTTTQLRVRGADDAGESNLKYTWTATSIPSGAAAPTFSVNGTNAASLTTVTFTKVGTYVFKATITDAGGLTTTSSVAVTVNQTFTSVRVTPSTPSILSGATQQFSATDLDQFGNAMAAQTAHTWTATQGVINSATGLFTAPGSQGSATIQATSGAIQGSTSITFTSLGLGDAGLAALTAALAADGSLSRLDMIQILQNAGDSGIVDATELQDLRTILTNAATYSMPSYVKALAGNVVNGNTANARYQGVALGNLAAGSSNLILNTLINKWFYGSDHPTIDANVPSGQTYTYRSATGTLYAGAPTHNNEFQGMLGDCYFIATIGVIADKSAAAVQNMFLDNGDNTWTVRFYANGVADYVTVDRMLPTDSYGRLVYANYGSMYNNSANTLWIPLAEKAYAQWNETGKEGRDGTNRYSAIEGGDPARVMTQVLGHSVSSYYLSSQSILVNAMQSNKAVTICTYSSPNSNGTLSYGLYGNHAYGVIGYNSSNGTFTLYNPWGSNQPTSSLTWAQLQTTCCVFEVGDATGSVALGAAVGSTLVAANAPIADVTVMDANMTPPSRSSEGDLAFSSRQESASRETNDRRRLFSSESGDGIDLLHDIAATQAWPKSEKTKSSPIFLLAVDDYFRMSSYVALN